MAMVYFDNEITEQGTSEWSKVNTVVDIYEGDETGYVAQVYFSDSYTKTLVAKANKYLSDAQAMDEFKNAKTGKPVKWRERPRMPYATDEKGKVYFKFKTSHLEKDKVTRKYVSIFDSRNNPLGNDVAIGNGSLVQISFTPSVNHKNEDVNGVKFFLNAIRVIKLESATSSNPFGDPVDGYVAKPETPFDTNEIAF